MQARQFHTHVEPFGLQLKKIGECGDSGFPTLSLGETSEVPEKLCAAVPEVVGFSEGFDCVGNLVGAPRQVAHCGPWLRPLRIRIRQFFENLAGFSFLALTNADSKRPEPWTTMG